MDSSDLFEMINVWASRRGGSPKGGPTIFLPEGRIVGPRECVASISEPRNIWSTSSAAWGSNGAHWGDNKRG